MRFLLALVLALSVLATGAFAQCRNDRIDLRGAFGAARFGVEVADTPRARAQGLMHVASLPASQGMLFVYPGPQTASFWMKNTLIPLDMIFIDASGVVRHVHARAQPGDETLIRGGDDILLVLEINGGLADRMGIAPGAEIRHPAVIQGGAAWPCE